MQRRVVEAVECGATEVCLQGGIHPDFDGDYYVDVARAVKEVAPAIHVHGFTALEVTEGARRLDMPLRDYLLRLKDAGLATLPGTAAEILDDEVRAIICPDKVNTEEWLFAHRTAHEVGLKSNVTIMHGTVERPVHVARHLVRTRDLQKETGGFTEFVPLPFVHMATPIFIQGKARRGPDVPRGAADARGRSHRVPRHDPERAGVVGEVRHRRHPPDPAGRRERSRRHADGREHLAGRGCEPRPGARRSRVPVDRRADRAHARAAHDAVRPHADGRPAAAPGRGTPGRPAAGRAHVGGEAVSRFDVLTLGNALVDVLAYADDDFVVRTGVEPGAMTMVDAARSDEIYAEMGPATEISGGSAANTAAGVASFGGKAAYIGRVADDTFGKVFSHDLRSLGRALRRAVRDRRVADRPLPRHRHARRASARCARSSARAPSSTSRYIDEALVASAAVTYLEGYIWDPPAAKEAVRRGRGDRAPRRPARRADALRPVLRRAAPRRVPSS